MIKCTNLFAYPEVYYEYYESVKNGSTIREFVNFVESKANTLGLDIDGVNKFKGDFLEVLSEMFFNAFSTDEAVGIKDYEPIDVVDDYGVDAVGINANNDKCVIQVKYRANVITDILYDDIARTYTAGKLVNKYDLDKPNTVWVFTTARGVSHTCQSVMGGVIKVINKSQIAHKIDNNKHFWEFTFNEISNTLKD